MTRAFAVPSRSWDHSSRHFYQKFPCPGAYGLLRWADIFWDERRIRIIIPWRFRCWLERALEGSHDSRSARQPEKEPIRNTCVEVLWVYLDECGQSIQRFGFHNFRHSLATFLVSRGKDVKTIQGLLGHAKVTTTLDLYSQSIDAAKLEARRHRPGDYKHRSSGLVPRAHSSAGVTGPCKLERAILDRTNVPFAEMSHLVRIYRSMDVLFLL